MPVLIANRGRNIKIIKKRIPGRIIQNCYEFEQIISLQHGVNDISIMAYNRTNTIESNRSSVRLIFRSETIEKPDLHILGIAVNRYKDVDLRLKFSLNDAEEIFKLLNSKARPLFNRLHIYKLYDNEVTKDRIEEMFETIGKKTKREDVFLFYAAGHGITYKEDGDYYYLPVNFRYTSDEAIPEQGVSTNDFKKYFTSIKAMKSLLLIDTCNSGSFAKRFFTRGMLEKTAINRLVRAVGRATIVASSKKQVALEGYMGHGVFTYTVLEALRGRADSNNDGRVTINELSFYIENRLPDISYKKWGYEQIPQKTLQGMDFPISMCENAGRP